jgi:hypothetical protein
MEGTISVTSEWDFLPNPYYIGQTVSKISWEIPFFQPIDSLFLKNFDSRWK